MTVLQLFPTKQTVDYLELAQNIASERSPVPAFDSDVINFLSALSVRLGKQARLSPALAPLAFFMRKAALKQLETQARQALPEHTIFVPQGVVFHIPPTNVDTLFLYTLSMSLLAGNRNIVRISRNSGPETFTVLNILFEELMNYPRVADLVTCVQFGHESEVLQAFSQACDLRMIWGGDETITSVKLAQLKPYATDLGFPDRISLSAIAVSAWNDSAEHSKDVVIEGLYNDIYWFDQMACSSPQSLLLVGGSTDEYVTAKKDIEARLSHVARNKYELPEGQAINKMVAAVRAVAAGATRIDWESNYSVSVDGLPVTALDDVRPGGGFLATIHLEQLTNLIPFVTRKTQTLSTFGFTENELIELVRLTNGRGIDRIVPIGSALDFSDVWDGKNLLLEMMRLVRIDSHFQI